MGSGVKHGLERGSHAAMPHQTQCHPRSYTPIHTAGRGAPGWGLLVLSLTHASCQARASASRWHWGPTPTRSRGTPFTGATRGYSPLFPLAGQSPAGKQLGQMAPCPGLAETNRELERRGARGVSAVGRGFGRPDPRAVRLAGALPSF